MKKALLISAVLILGACAQSNWDDSFQGEHTFSDTSCPERHDDQSADDYNNSLQDSQVSCAVTT